MKMKTRLNIIMILTGLLVAILVGQYLWHWKEHRDLIAMEEQYDQITAAFQELSALTGRMVWSFADRPIDMAWEEKYHRLVTLLGAIDNDGEETQAMKVKIRAHYGELLLLYERLQTTVSKDTGESVAQIKKREQIVGEMMMRMQATAALATGLVNHLRQRHYDTQQYHELVWLVLSILISIALALVISMIVRGLLVSLHTMQEGVARIAQGDLKHRIGLRGDNEFGAFSRLLDTMTERLSRTIVELEVEVKEHRSSEEALTQANRKLQELDRLKTMFIASMSHELRTPLNSIIGFSGILLQGMAGELNEKQENQLTRINQAGKHLLDLIIDVIDISKIEAGKIELRPETFLVSEAVDEVVREIAPAMEKKGLMLQVEVPENMGIYTDRRRMLQCLKHLFSNAVKFSEKGTIDIRASETSGFVEIAVSDEGIGINASDMKRLFRAFERFESHLKVIEGGSGLGLYLTRKIATELLGGMIDVQSSEGEGSRFTLKLPLRLMH